MEVCRNCNEKEWADAGGNFLQLNNTLMCSNLACPIWSAYFEEAYI